MALMPNEKNGSAIVGNSAKGYLSAKRYVRENRYLGEGIMCGITGIFERRGFSPHLLERMNNTAKHRGPDDEGYLLFSPHKALFARGDDTIPDLSEQTHIADFPETNEFYLGLAHRRLSILDLSAAGHQPMVSADGRISLVFNGEIYNYIEIRNELKEKGYHFITASDTEVIIASYLEWGEECVKRFNGMWAFALWDQTQETLFLSRDRLGAKPLYYYRDDEHFVFASELKQIICDSRIPRIMDEETLSAALVYGITDYSERTFLKDVLMLPPASNLILQRPATSTCPADKGFDIKVEPYWSLNISFQSKNPETVHDIGREFSRACAWRMRSDVPVAALLSGGLDSSAMVTEMGRFIRMQGKSPAGINTFTSCYRDSPENDESMFAHVVNQNSGTTENFVYPDVTNIEESFEKLVWHTDGWCSFPLLGANEVIKEVGRRGFKVCLNGQGGDENLFGYERYYAFHFFDLFKKLQWRKMLREYRLAARNSKLTIRQLLMYFLYFNIPLIRNRKKKNVARKYYTKAVLSTLNYEGIKRLLFPRNLKELVNNEICKTQLTHILRWDDRIYMSHSIESRVPFIDYQFVEEAAKIHPDLKIKNGYTKNILREYMNEKMPHSVTWRTNKLGFQAPTERFIANYSQKYLDGLFDYPRSQKYFNVQQIRGLMRTNPTHESVARFICIELFMRLFDVKTDDNEMLEG
ncbi:MAG: asparagine synthase (glutamine-hydrolyzing) [Clostridiales Family XIII bacterium]|jgi:asparagine synthase (glutamine-hydrolysing)|nr:asparagine synthase (glutamine-hydrolyzing) [Clostridiales Family XIII bacterium]